MKKINIILPIFNQEKYIQKNLNKLIKKLNQLKIVYKLILIDDKSVDQSLKIIKKFETESILVLKNKKNMGKGYSLKKAFSRVEKDCFVIIWDSDLPYYNRINFLIKKALQNDCKFISINRRLINSKIIQEDFSFYSLFRVFIGYVFNFFSRIVFSIDCKDTQAGLKGFDYSFIKYFKKTINDSFLFDLEMFIILKNLNIINQYVSCKYIVNRNSSIKINIFFLMKMFIDFFKIYKLYKKKYYEF